MRKKNILLIGTVLAVLAGCTQSSNNEAISGKYLRLDSNQFCRIRQEISVQPATNDARQEFTVTIKSWTDYFDDRPDKVNERPALIGKYDASTGILSTNDPGIVMYFDHKKKEAKLNSLALTKQ